jgi:two-component system cell cycle sensor histidine kinase/response regulator CckA
LIGENIVLQVRLAPRPALVKADPGQIEQVILNLVVNARDAMDSGGRISIESAHVEVSEPGRNVSRSSVLLSVTDTGHGMDEATRARIFEPFFTTKERGRGTGLGLATVYGIVEQSGGKITVNSEPGYGSTFKIYLPATRDRPSKQPPAFDHAVASGSPITVLLVEDEEMVRAVARRALEQHGITVIEAENAASALSLFRECPERFQAVVTDVVMPGMSGPALIEELLPLRPELKVLFMSGYTDNALVEQAVAERGFLFLQKPFAPVELVNKVRELTAITTTEKPEP